MIRASDLARLARQLPKRREAEWQAHPEVVAAAEREGVTVQDMVDRFTEDLDREEG